MRKETTKVETNLTNGNGNELGVNITPDERTFAKISYAIDCFLSLSTVLFSVVFLNAISEYNKNADGTAGYFDPRFLAEGFCNHNKLPTMKHCAFFDWTMAVSIFLFGILYPSPSQPDYGAIAYLAGHGFGHWEFHNNPISSSNNKVISDPVETVVLAIIIGFAGCKFTLEVLTHNKGWDKVHAMIFAGTQLALLCYVYAVHVQLKMFGLTYINMSIMLILDLGRTFFVGYKSRKDIIFRSKLMGMKHGRLMFVSHYVIKILIATIVWLEPLTCSSFFSHLGGHFWFDISLFLDILHRMMVDHANDKMESLSSIQTAKVGEGQKKEL